MSVQWYFRRHPLKSLVDADSYPKLRSSYVNSTLPPPEHDEKSHRVYLCTILLFYIYSYFIFVIVYVIKGI